MGSHDLQIDLMFLQWQKLYQIEKPFQIFINIPDDAQDQRDTNLVFEKVPCMIQDIRDVAYRPSLDEAGFIYRRHATKTTDFTNRMMVDQNYLPEIEKLLKRELDGVDRVFFFDWRVCKKFHSRDISLPSPTLTKERQLRKNAPEVEDTVIDMNDLTTWLRPAVHVHIGTSLTS